MIKKLHLPIHSEVLNLGGDLTATLEHPAQIEFSREVSREELAERLVAGNRADLLPMLEHEETDEETGIDYYVTYSPVNGEAVKTIIADPEDLATEAQTRAEFEKKSIPELKKFAEEYSIEIPESAKKKPEIIDAIMPHIGTLEAMNKPTGEEKEEK